MPLTPGDTLFEYRITRALGQGAFGTVYLAQDTLLDRPVAIKELTSAAQADRAAFQRFLQEARAAGSLNHPNIVTIYALKPADAAVYLVMEYLPGGSLRVLLNQRGRLLVDDAARIAADVCDGLAAAHARGIVHRDIVHRDIKPENILLTADGRAKVGDFGIAHVPRAAGGAYLGGLTEAGFQPGTLIYMSPEQIRGEAVDGRSDVYQVGALLYEMLAGRDYIDVETLTRRAQETAGGNVLRMQARLYDLLEEAICKHEPPDVHRLRPDVPGWLGATVVTTLARQAATRPTAEQLAGELRNRKNDSPLEQDAASGRSAMSIVDDLLSKKTVERPAGAAPSRPITTPTANKAIPPAVPGPQTAHGGREAKSSSGGSLNEAIRQDQDALHARPDEAKAHFNLGVVYGQQGHIGEAIWEFQAALQANTHYTEAHFNLGVIYGQQGHTDEAIREFQAVLRTNPDYAEAHFNLGMIYSEQGRTEEAIRSFQAVLRTSPDNAEAHFNLGTIYSEQGRIEEAIRSFQAVLRTSPDNAEAHSNLGVIYSQQDRTEEAIREYQAALRNNPDLAFVHANLGAIYAKQGRADEAIREYQAALRVNPTLAKAHFNLGVAYKQQGRLVEARREALRALELGCYEPARELVESLG